MREILFRGKKDNREWVEGSLSLEYGEATQDGNRKVDYRILGMRCDCDYVIPETVGQYTGLTDKNCKKIFEGDILERRHKEIFRHSQKMIVKFVPVKACFAAVDLDGGNVTFISDYINNKYELEIIGNIHDNSELLKEVE